MRRIRKHREVAMTRLLAENKYELVHGSVYHLSLGGASFERIVVYLCLTAISMTWMLH